MSKLPFAFLARGPYTFSDLDSDPDPDPDPNLDLILIHILDSCPDPDPQNGSDPYMDLQLHPSSLLDLSLSKPWLVKCLEEKLGLWA